MPIPMLPMIGSNDRLYKRVSWADPGLVLSANEAVSEDITLVANVVTKVASNDPKRWAVGFYQPGSAGVEMSLGTFPDVFTPSKRINNIWTDNWYTIFQYGPLVCGEWYAVTPVGGICRVTTVLISV